MLARAYMVRLAGKEHPTPAQSPNHVDCGKALASTLNSMASPESPEKSTSREEPGAALTHERTTTLAEVERRQLNRYLGKAGRGYRSWES